jgi:hypothetical protein
VDAGRSERVSGGSLVKFSMFAWGCVVWYNVWYDAGGISPGCAGYGNV